MNISAQFWKNMMLTEQLHCVLSRNFCMTVLLFSISLTPFGKSKITFTSLFLMSNILDKHGLLYIQVLNFESNIANKEEYLYFKNLFRKYKIHKALELQNIHKYIFHRTNLSRYLHFPTVNYLQLVLRKTNCYFSSFSFYEPN